MPPSRIANHHNPKRNLLGNKAAQVPPAWRDQKQKEQQGSKILLSHLPPDVGELEVEESSPLFTPAIRSDACSNRNSFARPSVLSKKSFLSTIPRAAQRAWPSSRFNAPGTLLWHVPNTTASSLTVVSTALVACSEPPRYPLSGRPIKIEVVVDSTHPTAGPLYAPEQPSLLGRLGVATANPPLSFTPHDHAPNGTLSPPA